MVHTIGSQRVLERTEIRLYRIMSGLLQMENITFPGNLEPTVHNLSYPLGFHSLLSLCPAPQEEQ